MPPRSSPEIPSLSLAGQPATLPTFVPESVSGPDQTSESGLSKRVHLLLCTNSLYLQHAGVCLISLLANNPDLFFDVVIVGRVTELLDEEKLRRSLTRFPNHSLSFRNFTPPADRILPLNPRAHYTLDNWTRLWVAEF